MGNNNNNNNKPHTHTHTHTHTEENKRMRKTRDLFKKIGDTKGIFHAKMGTIKDGMAWS